MAQSATYLRFFPYDRPYDHQLEAMGRINEALHAQREVLFEGACGTGKTLAALVPALEYAREEGKTVAITTNVHQQMRQFIHEARAITREESIRAVVFRGKSSMCHIDVGYRECQALRDETHAVVDDGMNAEDHQAQTSDHDQTDNDGTICERYHRNLTTETQSFYEWLFKDVRTPDEIYEYAHRQGLCGYELLKDGIEGIDLVICNYHHLLDPTIRTQFFTWLGREPGDVVAVFDEAHNIEAAARDHATRQRSESTFNGALAELDGVDDLRVAATRNVIQAFRDALVATYEAALDRLDISDSWTVVPITNERGRDDLTLTFLSTYTGPGYEQDLEQALALGWELDRQYEQDFRAGQTTTRRDCRILQAAEFIQGWMADGASASQHPIVSVRRNDTGTPYGRAELYTCIPRSVTQDLFEDLHASVLMSATLRPFDVLSDVLGVSGAVEMDYGPQFPPERRRTYAVETPALYASRRDDPGVQSSVAEVLTHAIEFTPGNVLAFFPSYAEAERYSNRIDVEATLYLDEPGVRANGLRETFVDDENGVLLTSLWGTLGEGVSYDGSDARTVVVVGVPYPRLDDRTEAVQRAYSRVFDGEDAGWRYAVEIPTVRKTRQALGRVVRAPDDYGARILVDERYTAAASDTLDDYSVFNTFPEEERAETIDITPEKLRVALLNFFTDLDAWTGDAPTP